MRSALWPAVPRPHVVRFDAPAGVRAEVDDLASRLRAAGGAVTQRVIRDPELVGSVIEAWCELRQDDRVFAVSRVLSVAPAP